MLHSCPTIVLQILQLWDSTQSLKEYLLNLIVLTSAFYSFYKDKCFRVSSFVARCKECLQSSYRYCQYKNYWVRSKSEYYLLQACLESRPLLLLCWWRTVGILSSNYSMYEDVVCCTECFAVPFTCTRCSALFKGYCYVINVSYPCCSWCCSWWFVLVHKGGQESRVIGSIHKCMYNITKRRCYLCHSDAAMFIFYTIRSCYSFTLWVTVTQLTTVYRLHRVQVL